MRARFLVGPAIAAAGIWCALGRLSVLSADHPSVRVGIPAGFAAFVGAVLVATLVPGWRRRPLTATPALLSILPWLPVPMPAVAFIWTGRLAWVPVALALLASIAMRSADDGEPGSLTSAVGSPRRHVLAATALTLAAALCTAWSLAPRLPGGDEPHYLIITQSLLKDRDIRIANNHVDRDYAAYFAGELRPDKIQDGKNGDVYSIHAPGTSVLVLPAFAAFGYRGAQLTVILLAALTGAFIWYAGWLATNDRTSAWVAWAALTGSATFLFQSVTIFPDGPGAFVAAFTVVTVELLVLRALDVGVWRLVLTGALLAGLPWLHTRFSVLAAALALVLVWQLLREDRPFGERVRRVAMFVAIPVVSAAGWFAFFQVIYGTPNPSAPYGPDPQTSLTYIPGGLLALLFDQQFGLLLATPIVAAAFAGALRRDGAGRGAAASLVRPFVLVALAYFAAVAVYWMWWAGVPATPARFSSAALPVLAAPIALAWRRAGRSRALWRVLLAVSLALSVLFFGIDRGALLWNFRQTARAAWLDWTDVVADIARGLPSFFWRLDPGHVRSELGFGLHAFSTAAIFVVFALAAVAFTRRRGHAAEIVASWWFLVTTMAAVQSGWLLNRVEALNAARSQLTVLAGVASDGRAVQIAPLSWRVVGMPAMHVRAARSDADDGSPMAWATFENVPAGRYDVEIRTEAPARGAVTIQVGSHDRQTFELPLAARARFPLRLPAGARAVRVVPDAALQPLVRALELVPVSLVPNAVGLAQASKRYGLADVFFFDDAVFVEEDGFWIRGGATSAFAIAPPADAPTIRLELANGAAANAVQLDLPGQAAQTVRLRASETRTFDVVVPASGLVQVKLTSPAGFRPSDVSASRDTRYLGVRVVVR